jgi:heme/copper-type cytochrome/quinol oxidase subunit 2
MFKWILLAGWALLLIGAFLIIEFPNAAWNHFASVVVWIFSIALIIATGVSVVVAAIRLISRLIRPSARQPAKEVQARFAKPGRLRPRWLAIALITTAGVAAFVSVLLVVIEREIKSSPVYQTSIERAQESPEVSVALGRPVSVGWFVSGQLTESTNGGGHATQTIPLSGPRGDGTLHVDAKRQAGSWRFSTLQFATTGSNSTADLLSEQTK